MPASKKPRKSRRPVPPPAAKPRTDTAAKPRTDTAAKPRTDTAAEPGLTAEMPVVGEPAPSIAPMVVPAVTAEELTPVAAEKPAPKHGPQAGHGPQFHGDSRGKGGAQARKYAFRRS
ncbi:hypothetical protein ACK8GE_20515 [Micromonosporaceae bacterium DT194]|uniref:hypothetical protein n=1 Tax=Melissospora conviva TaxID=3388432 RepID=UPI003C1AD3F5